MSAEIPAHPTPPPVLHPPISPNPVVESDAACAICGHALRRVPLRGHCPGCGIATRRALLPTVDDEVACTGCGYNLKGLDPSGQCPECGQPVARSLQGNLLRFSGADYLAALHKGAFLVQAAIIIQVISVLGGLAGMFGVGILRGSPQFRGVEQFMHLGGFVASLVTLGGWWLLSAPDPAQSLSENGATARRVVRVSAVVLTLATAVTTSVHLAYGNPAMTTASPMALLWMAAMGASLVAWIVWYFAAMRYLRWLTPRLPNQKAHDRAKLLTWLGPVLYLFGCGIGQIVALVMYYNLLGWIRNDLKQIRETQAAEGGYALP